MPVEVELVEELGSDAYVYGHATLDTGGASERFVVRTTSTTDTPTLGDEVYVKPRVGKHHAFHAVTGESI